LNENLFKFFLKGEEILMTDNRDITWAETDDPNACQSNETVYQLYSRDPVRTPFQVIIKYFISSFKSELFF
jgi:hypothetical protein